MKPGKNFTSWRENRKSLRSENYEIPDISDRIGHGKMLVPTPILVDEVVRKVPKGKLVGEQYTRETGR